jgi:hypothetical protein
LSATTAASAFPEVSVPTKSVHSKSVAKLAKPGPKSKAEKVLDLFKYSEKTCSIRYVIYIIGLSLSESPYML